MLVELSSLFHHSVLVDLSVEPLCEPNINCLGQRFAHSGGSLSPGSLLATDCSKAVVLA